MYVNDVSVVVDKTTLTAPTAAFETVTTAATGIRNGGELYCWGNNDIGQVGDGTQTDRLVPTRVGTANDWTDIAAGEDHNCGIRNGGDLYCWGANSMGQLGNGTGVARRHLHRCSGRRNHGQLLAPPATAMWAGASGLTSFATRIAPAGLQTQPGGGVPA